MYGMYDPVCKKKKINLDFFFFHAGLVTLVLTDAQNNIPII